jgi:hypothetical protein
VLSLVLVAEDTELKIFQIVYSSEWWAGWEFPGGWGVRNQVAKRVIFFAAVPAY